MYRDQATEESRSKAAETLRCAQGDTIVNGVELIRVTIVSPNHALRVGLREMLNDRPDITVVGDANNLESINEKETEVLVLASVSMVQFTKVHTESLGLLVLTDDPQDAYGLFDSKARAWGVVSASATGDELAAAVRAVGEGLWVGAPALVRGLMRSVGDGNSSGEEPLIEPLTAREREVLQWIAEGLANKQIAVRLGISEHTVKFHLSSLYAKLNVASRTEAVKRGLGLGLISL
jgi:DNA-binding NarL/FixJ family response regulator